VPDMNLRLQFVDSIAAAPTVRLNLNSTTWATLADTRFDPPPLRRALNETLMADGATPAASAYGNRTIVLVLQLPQSLSYDQAANALQTLMMELDRESNLLMYQPGTAAPVFFRTYRTPPDSVDFDTISRQGTVSILAEPFGYGLEQTQSPVTVTNNPAAGSNGMFLDVTSPLGDVETPVQLVVSTGVVATGRRLSAFATRRRGTVASCPLVLQVEAMTQSTDTTVQANNASFSGAGSNFSRTTFATVAGLTRRATSSKFPASASVDNRGTYRVFLRGRQNTSGDSIDARLVWGSVDSVITNTYMTWVGGDTLLKYGDLGLVQIPGGYDPGFRTSGVEVSTEGIFIGVDLRRSSGSGTFDLDHLLFLPADDRQLFVKWPAAATGVTDFVLEGGVRPAVYARNASAQVVTAAPVELIGGGLMVSPGRTTRIFMALDVGPNTGGSGDAIANTVSVTPSYFPRYLRPATS
jgi:hypothetical protein